MSITVTCDDCSETHRVRDEAVGKRFPCKGCGKSLKVKAPLPVEELDDLEDADEDADDGDADFDFSRSAPKRSKSSGIKKKSSQKGSGKRSSATLGRSLVPLGLNCIYWSFMTTVLIMISVFVVAFFSGRQLWFLLPFVMVMRVLALGAGLVTMIGKLMCLTAPARMSGKPFIVIAALIDLLAFSLGIANLITDLPRPLAAGIGLISVAGFVCFILFLQQLGRHLRESDIVNRATGLLILGSTFVVTWLGIILMAALRANDVLILPAAALGVMMGIMGLALLVMGVLGVIRYAGLLSACCWALDRCD